MSETVKIPEISRITEFHYTNTVQIYGENFTEKSLVYIWYPQNPVEGTTPYGVTLPQLPPEESSVFKFDTLFRQVGYIAPNRDIQGRMAIVWVKNEAGFSPPFKANYPRIFNQSHVRATAGDVLHLAGSAFGERRNKIILLHDLDTGKNYYVKNATDVNYCYNREYYTAEFIIPEDLPDGNYEVFLSGGFGAQYGWSDPISLEIYSDETLTGFFRNKWNDLVKRHRVMPKARKICIPAPDCGSEVDMAEEIQNAVDSLSEAGGGIVRLTAGIYGISRTVVMKPGVVLKGAGSENTVIRAHDELSVTQDWSDVEFAARHNGLKRWAIDWKRFFVDDEVPNALLRLTTDTGVEDLKLELGNGGDMGILLSNIRDSHTRGLFVNNVSVDSGFGTVYNNDNPETAAGAGLYSISNNTDLVVFNCTFKTLAPIIMLPARNRRIKLINNLFDCSPKQQHQSFVCGLTDSVVVSNTFSNGRRSFICQDGFSNNFVYQNRSVGVSRSENALENYMSEYGASVWHGCPEKVGENYFDVEGGIDQYVPGETFAERMSEYDQYVCIMDGRGFGQYRKIIGSDGGRIYIDKPWDVMPDRDTLFTVIEGSCNNIWLNNSTELCNGPTQFIWGAGLDNIIAGQEISLSYALTMHSFGLTPPEEGMKQKCCMCVVAYNRVIGCQVKASGMGFRSDADMIYPQYSDEFTPRFKRTNGLIGIAVQRNAFEGSIGACYLKNQAVWMEENYNSGIEIGGAYNLVENNLVAGYPTAVKLRYDNEGNYFAKNAFIGNDSKFAYEVRANDYTGRNDRVAGPDSSFLWF